MLSTAAPQRTLPSAPSLAAGMPSLSSDGDQRASRDVADTLKLLVDTLAPQRRVVHAGDVIYRAGERFGNLYVMNSGFFKLVTLSPDGREQVVSLNSAATGSASTASRKAPTRATRSRWIPATSG
jgi:CRP/FNR family transcriptional regulator